MPMPLAQQCLGTLQLPFQRRKESAFSFIHSIPSSLKSSEIIVTLPSSFQFMVCLLAESYCGHSGTSFKPAVFGSKFLVKATSTLIRCIELRLTAAGKVPNQFKMTSEAWKDPRTGMLVSPVSPSIDPIGVPPRTDRGTSCSVR